MENSLRRRPLERLEGVEVPSFSEEELERVFPGVRDPDPQALAEIIKKKLISVLVSQYGSIGLVRFDKLPDRRYWGETYQIEYSLDGTRYLHTLHCVQGSGGVMRIYTQSIHEVSLE